MHSFTWTQVSVASVLIASPQIMSKMNVLLIEAVVRGYHQCPFTVRTGDQIFTGHLIECD